jgi:hypothetical protein
VLFSPVALFALMSSTQSFPAIPGAAAVAQKESAVEFDLEMKSSWGQGLPLRVRSDFNINDVRQEIMKKYAWAPKQFRLLLNGQEPRLELTLKDLGIEQSSVLLMQTNVPSSQENESIYRELSHVLYESKKSESQWRCTKATAGVARSGLLQSMHDPDKGVSDFSDFLKQRMGEVREFSSDWSKFNNALHRYKKSVSTLDLDRINSSAPVNSDTDSYIRSVNSIDESIEDHRLKRVTVPPLKIVSTHRSPKSKADQGSCVRLDREFFLKEARDHQLLVKTDFMHKAQAQFLQQQMDNLQKIIVEKGPLEVDPAKCLRRMKIACTLPWDESLRRGYRENPDWLRQQRQTIDIFGGESGTLAKSKVPIEQVSKAVLTVTFDIQELSKTDSVIGPISPPKHSLQRTTHLSDPTLNRIAMQDAVAVHAKYAGSNVNLDFRPPVTKPHMPYSGDSQHPVHTSSQDKSRGIRTPTLKNSSVTKRGLSKDWRER